MKQLETYLLEKKLITKDQLEHAKKLNASQNGPLSKLLEELNYVSETDILKFFATKFNIPFKEKLNTIDLPRDKVGELPFRKLKEWGVSPVHLKNKILQVATANPLSLEFIDTLRSYFDVSSIDIIISPQKTVEKTLNQLFTKKELSLNAEVSDWQKEFQPNNAISHKRIETDTPLLKIVDQLINAAILKHATDIHFQPGRKGVSMKYRVDGVLFQQQQFENDLYAEIISRLKVLSQLDITEKRRSQDGRFTFEAISGDKVDIRVSIIPTSWGERLVLRILHKENLFVPWDRLGFSPEGENIVKRHIQLNNGMILVNGPTGAGKTTTLYSCLDRINDGIKNIITIEDPIEYDLDGISQMSLNHKINVSFSNALRSVLRQDPDVIMVGEIRDQETAKIAIRSALTGHLVFSTLHANDTLQSIVRLIDIGIEPYLISSAISLLIAQRLVRKLCPDCKKPLSKDLTKEFIFKTHLSSNEFKEATIFSRVGCEKCLNTGFKGRVALYEILELDDELKQHISNYKNYHHFKKHLLETSSSFSSLKMEGIKKVISGVTTESEVLSATSYM